MINTIYKEVVLRRIVVNDFLALRDGFEMNYVPGVNVIIGENGSGKTSLLKLIYAVRTNLFRKNALDRLLEEVIASKRADAPYEPVKFKIPIFQYFDADNNDQNDIRMITGTLPKHSKYSYCEEAHVDNDDAILYFDVLHDDTYDNEIPSKELLEESHGAVYIPEKDILSHSKGLLALNTRRSIPFDQTFIDLLSSAELGRIREIPTYMVELMKRLAEVSGGEVVYQDDQFHIRKANGELVPFSYEASGFKRFGLLWQLIQNGQIRSGSTLFWDEPDNSLNPMLIFKLAEALMELSRHQIQIFVATHNETLARCMALHCKEGDSLMFHAMYRDDRQQIKACSAPAFEQLDPNSLTAARVKLYDAEMAKAFGHE